jgi:hypothetical protein
MSSVIVPFAGKLGPLTTGCRAPGRRVQAALLRCIEPPLQESSTEDPTCWCSRRGIKDASRSPLRAASGRRSRRARPGSPRVGGPGGESGELTVGTHASSHPAAYAATLSASPLVRLVGGGSCRQGCLPRGSASSLSVSGSQPKTPSAWFCIITPGVGVATQDSKCGGHFFDKFFPLRILVS